MYELPLEGGVRSQQLGRCSVCDSLVRCQFSSQQVGWNQFALSKAMAPRRRATSLAAESISTASIRCRWYNSTSPAEPNVQGIIHRVLYRCDRAHIIMAYCMEVATQALWKRAASAGSGKTPPVHSSSPHTSAHLMFNRSARNTRDRLVHRMHSCFHRRWATPVGSTTVAIAGAEQRVPIQHPPHLSQHHPCDASRHPPLQSTCALLPHSYLPCPRRPRSQTTLMSRAAWAYGTRRQEQA
jgi:hypothetical protein